MIENQDSLHYQQLFKTSNSPADYTDSIYLFYIELAQITELTDQLVLYSL